MPLSYETVTAQFSKEIYSMMDTAKELPYGGYDRIRLEAAADSLAEALEITESILSHSSEAQLPAKYDLVGRMVWTDEIDAKNALKAVGSDTTTLAYARKAGTLDGIELAKEFLAEASK